MKPLFEVVDPDALDAIFRTATGERSSSGATVRFEYGDYLVTVDGSGESGRPEVTVDTDAVIE